MLLPRHAARWPCRYVDLFANTFKGLKAADPGLRVGGPATAQLAWLDVFVEGAVKAGAPPDFVSSHLYPTDPWAHEDALPKGRDAFFNAIAEAAEITSASAKKHGITSHMPFVLTEFNCGLGMDCADSFYSASFIAHHALNSQAIVSQVPIQSYVATLALCRTAPHRTAPPPCSKSARGQRR